MLLQDGGQAEQREPGENVVIPSLKAFKIQWGIAMSSLLYHQR